MARDSAQHDSAAVAERLAAVSVEAQQKHAQLTQERDAAQTEKERVAAELEQARETHKAQAGVFASEFKTVVKQRDEALAQLDAERTRLAAKLAEFEHERAAMAANETEVKTRAERDLARLRRERDSIAQQRDALRERIGKLVNEQREMLEDVTAQAAFTAMKHTDIATMTPEAAAPEPQPEPVKPRETKKKRLESERQLETLGLDDLLTADALVLVEWGESSEIRKRSTGEIVIASEGGDARKITVTLKE